MGDLSSSFRTLAYLVLLFFVMGLSACCPSYNNALVEGLALKDFEQAGPLAVYNKRNLYDYIDGEADVYLPLGFRLLYTQTYRHKQTGAQMMVEVYDMGTQGGAASAYAKFAVEPGSFIPRLGETAWTGSGMVLFHRDQCYLKVYADPSSGQEARASHDELLALSFVIDQALKR